MVKECGQEMKGGSLLEEIKIPQVDSQLDGRKLQNSMGMPCYNTTGKWKSWPGAVSSHCQDEGQGEDGDQQRLVIFLIQCNWVSRQW
jgi:hypothetical protein